MTRAHSSAGLALAAVTAGVVAGMGGAVAIETPASAAGPFTYQHNICGALGCSWFGDTVVNGGLEFWMNNNPPDGTAIGTQETCASQLGDFKTFLANRSSNWHNSLHENAAVSGGCGSSTPVFYGVAAWGLTPPGSSRATEGTFADQRPGDERRGYACVLGGVPSPNHYSCSAHLANTSPYKSLQVQDYYDIVQLGSLARPVYWGGDLYIDTGTWPFDVSSRYKEAQYCVGGLAPTHLPNHVWDWAFYGPTPVSCDADGGLWPFDINDVCQPSPGCGPGQYTSDHRLVAGYQH